MVLGDRKGGHLVFGEGEPCAKLTLSRCGPKAEVTGGSGTPQPGAWAVGREPRVRPLAPMLSPQCGGFPGVGATTGKGGFEPWGQLPGHDLGGMAETWGDGCRAGSTQDAGQAEALKATFASVSTGPTGRQESPVPAAGERLAQGRRPLGRRGSAPGTLKETGHPEGNGHRWDAPARAEGSGCWHCKATLNNLRRVTVTGRRAGGLEESKRLPHLQAGQEGGPREPQAREPRLLPWEGDGAATPGNHFQARE